MYELPRSRAAIAYSELAGNGQSALFNRGSSSAQVAGKRGRSPAGVRWKPRSRRSRDRASRSGGSAADRPAADQRSAAASRPGNVEVGQGGDRRPDVPGRAGANAGFDPLQLVAALVDHFAAGRAHFRGHAIGLAAQRQAADLMAADRQDRPTRPGQDRQIRRSWLTSPVEATRPFFNATNPTIVVMATPPLLPISQMPIRRFTVMQNQLLPCYFKTGHAGQKPALRPG